MRILVVSDTHGFAERLEAVLAETGPVHALIHCGDVEGQESYVQSLVDGPCYMVSGNNDWGSELPREIETTIGDYRVFITHGHRYGVSLGTERMRDEAMSRKAHIAIFGHTHRPLVETHGGLTLLNPGSLTYPRQIGRKPTYILMETDREHEARFSIRQLEG